MKLAPTLIDEIYRISFRPERQMGWRSNAEMRHALEAAKRFVIADDRTAGFMAELANESFVKAGIHNPIVPRIADSLRVQSRLPFPSIWIEYPLRAYQARSCELRGTLSDNTPELQPLREGWLIQQHPKIDTACIMHLFTQDDKTDHQGHAIWTFPFAFAWCCDDSPLPWRLSVKHQVKSETMSAVLVGLQNYDRDNVGCVRSPLITDPNRDHGEAYEYLFSEWMGVVRRVWALLATIDNLPITRGEVRQSKGFLARGRIRKFLDHQTITLNIPQKTDTRVLARKAIAIAHRKRHEVRAHWRDDWRFPPSKRCNPHLWEFMNENDLDHIRCDLCGGRQIHVKLHERGDAALGYVTHNYAIKHPTTEKKWRI
jgi:hypothetical protein